MWEYSINLLWLIYILERISGALQVKSCKYAKVDPKNNEILKLIMPIYNGQAPKNTIILAGGYNLLWPPLK